MLHLLHKVLLPFLPFMHRTRTRHTHTHNKIWHYNHTALWLRKAEELEVHAHCPCYRLYTPYAMDINKPSQRWSHNITLITAQCKTHTYTRFNHLINCTIAVDPCFYYTLVCSTATAFRVIVVLCRPRHPYFTIYIHVSPIKCNFSICRKHLTHL